MKGLLLVFFVFSISILSAQEILPPSQPDSGPGGAEYICDSIHFQDFAQWLPDRHLTRRQVQHFHQALVKELHALVRIEDNDTVVQRCKKIRQADAAAIQGVDGFCYYRRFRHTAFA